MDDQFAPYVKLSQHDRPSDTPGVVLKLEASHKLWKDSSYSIFFTLERIEDGHDEPCIFVWSLTTDGFRPWGFVLLHHTADGGLEKIDICDKVLALETPDVLFIDGYHSHGGILRELPPAGSDIFMASLDEHYQKLLVPGERYELIWPGGEIALWDWGTIKEHAGQVLRPKPHRLVLPGGPRVSFTVEEGEMVYVWKRPVSPPPIEPLARVPGAPVLSVELECPPTVTHDGPLTVTTKVIYHGLADGAEDGRPITFRLYALQNLDTLAEGFHLYCRSNGKWERYYDHDFVCGWKIYDDPDIPVNVSQDEGFVSLQPGECWTWSQLMQNPTWSGLPDDRAVGDVFRFMYKGGTVDWWDWGAREEHANTVVKIPCWITGNVTDPADNAGRPKLVVPASNAVEFTIVE